MLWHGVPPGVDTLLFWGYGNQAVNWVRNYTVFRTTQLTRDVLEEATRYVLRTQPTLCVGLPSAIAEWARYVRANHPDLPRIHVPFMKLGGEQIYRFHRDPSGRSARAGWRVRRHRRNFIEQSGNAARPL
jgi:hypothetical protein